MIRLILWNAALATAFLLGLCALDLVFVYGMEEEVSFLNKLPLMVVAMPFISLVMSNKILIHSGQSKSKPIRLIFVFVIMSALAFFELLWVATHFHTMIGGTV